MTLLAMNERLAVTLFNHSASAISPQRLTGDEDLSQAYHLFMLMLFVDTLLAVLTVRLVMMLGYKIGLILFKKSLLKNKPSIPVKLGPSGKLPKRANSKDAGLDMFASESVIINNNEGARVLTDIRMEIPDGYVGLILDRSSLGAKGIHVHGGVVDSPYRGEIKVVLWNHGSEPYSVQKGDKIAQIVILPIILNPAEQTEDLSISERGTKGFGSSGR